jgi:hypothetical protein
MACSCGGAPARRKIATMRRVLPLLLLACSCDFELYPLAVDGGFDLSILDGPARDFAYNPDALTGDGGLRLCPGGVLAVHVGDIAEGDVSRWGAQALPPLTASPATTTVSADSSRVVEGAISVRLDSTNAQAALFYPAERNAAWDLTLYATLKLQITADNTSAPSDPGWDGPQPHILILTDRNNYYELIPETDLLPRRPGPYATLQVPLAGGAGWSRSVFGLPSLFNINYVALTFASTGPTFSVWVDGVTFGPTPFLDCSPP